VSSPPLSSRLEMRNISISFGGFSALHQVDFTLEGGAVHALVGANGAGKSTLMAVLSGAYSHYSGQIIIDGKPVTISQPHHAREQGIHLVQQEVDIALIPTLNVAENIMLDELSEAGHLHHWSKIYQSAQELTQQLGLKINLRERIENCTLAEKQLILLARALSHQCRFLILDEPTAPLDHAESERLFALVRRLRDEGMAVVFISHRIHELRDICDRMTVLRDGRLVSDDSMRGLTNEHIIEKMIGHQINDIYPARRPAHGGETLLKIKGLHDKHKLRDISLTLHRGEILGIAGLAGAGKTELCKALFGASPSRVDHGELYGKAWKPSEPYLSVEQGIALVPEERRKEGVFIDEDIPMNLSVAADNSFSTLGIFNRAASLSWAKEIILRTVAEAGSPLGGESAEGRNR
jgi:simple sugar transport system ATP-binding protein